MGEGVKKRSVWKRRSGRADEERGLERTYSRTYREGLDLPVLGVQ